MGSDYAAFLDRRTQSSSDGGFDPIVMPEFLFDFQKHFVAWALRKGRAAVLADCGLGKSAMELVWAENVVRRTNGRVLILTPLAVGIQMVAEGAKFGIECERSRDSVLPNKARIVVANYESLHKFSPDDFAGVVCDEASILKHFTGATQKQVTRFLTKIPFRLLGTATAAPNDFIELGTLSEALGVMGYTDMLGRFFRQTDAKRHRMEEIKQQKRVKAGGEYYAKLAFRVAQQIGQWRLKGHAIAPFWRWVASWAMACRKPSDLGFKDDGFVLPPLTERAHVIAARKPPEGMLFTLPAFGLGEERDERRRTLNERCEFAAQLVEHDQAAIVWVQMNNEGDLIEKLIPGAVQIAGRDSDEAKEDRIAAFLSGEARVLVTKSKIAGFGLNFQHCAHVVTFATHSYEAHYQSVRRCWRFGQTQPVVVDVIATEGEQRVSENMMRKAEQASEMFDQILSHMHAAERLTHVRRQIVPEVPKWLSC